MCCYNENYTSKEEAFAKEIGLTIPFDNLLHMAIALIAFKEYEKDYERSKKSN